MTSPKIGLGNRLFTKATVEESYTLTPAGRVTAQEFLCMLNIRWNSKDSSLETTKETNK